MKRRARVVTATVGALVTILSVGCRGIRPPDDVEPFTRTLETTGYCPCRECCGWRRTWWGRPVVVAGPNKGKRKTIGQTASGRQARVGTIAADTSLYPFGTIMHVPGYGYGRVEDRGGAIKGERIDLFFRSHSEAKEWGRKQQRVRIWLPERER